MLNTNPNSQVVQDAKAMAHATIRSAIALAREMLEGVHNPVKPTYARAAEANDSKVAASDPTGKVGIAGGAHELDESKSATMDDVLAAHEEAPKPDFERKPMDRIDGAAYHLLLSRVPDEYKSAFEPFEKLILDPHTHEEQLPLVVDDFDSKARADVQLGAGLALVDFESILRA